MADVLFVIPAVDNIIEQPPLGTLLLATILRKNGFSAEIFPLPKTSEFPDFSAFLDETAKNIIKRQARILSFYTRCDCYHLMLKVSERLKGETNATIVFGGPQADIVANETLHNFSYVDYVCQGEGETTIVPFFSSLLCGVPDVSVDGLVYRYDGKIVNNPRPALLQDLDVLPDIDYSIIGMNGSHCDARRFPIDVGRGCPFGCSYCSTKTFWGRKYRLKSPERICNEVKLLNSRFGIRSFSFSHDMFTLERNQVISVCRLLKEQNLDVEWTCSARIDCIDEELIDCMVDAGMNRIFMGVETGSDRMQKLIHKNLKLEMVMSRLRYIHSKGIRIAVSFIVGFPEETLEDLSQTLYLIGEIAKLKNVQIHTHLCAFLPGTELSRCYAGKMTPMRFFSDITGTEGVKACETLIRNHPDVFPQFWEYSTELRTKLKEFSLFIDLWCAIEPVYRYLSEQFENDRLIDMYFAFLECNRDLLAESADLPHKEKIHLLLQHDNLHRRFIPEHLKDTVQDCYRMACIPYAMELKDEKQMIEVFSFSPLEFKNGIPITDYQKQAVIAAYERLDDDKIKIKIKTF